MTTQEKKDNRRQFLQSCCDHFLEKMHSLHRVAYCDPNVPNDLMEAYYEMLPEIRAELAEHGEADAQSPHPVDRHKVAAATAQLILATQPMRDAVQLHSSGTYEGEPCSGMNSLFAMYTVVAILDQWRALAGEDEIRISEKAKRFIREHVKLMTKCHQYPIFMAAQAFYLFEELCLAEEQLLDVKYNIGFILDRIDG